MLWSSRGDCSEFDDEIVNLRYLHAEALLEKRGLKDRGVFFIASIYRKEHAELPNYMMNKITILLLTAPALRAKLERSEQRRSPVHAVVMRINSVLMVIKQ